MQGRTARPTSQDRYRDMKKANVSLRASSSEAAITDPRLTRSKTPDTSKRKKAKATNRHHEAATNLRRNGSRKDDEHENQLDVEQVLAALEALKKGDFSTRLPVA